MSYTNSPLVTYTKISPNRGNIKNGKLISYKRNNKIDTISIHCAVGQLSVETLGNIFAQTSKQASSNYGIGYDGKIGMYCEEKDRSWCTSSSANDNRAITIEVASDSRPPYAINDTVYKALIELCIDICKRNGIKELKWKADKSLIGQPDKQNMTVHRWFANKACPGEYIYNRLGQIAKEVNAKLTASEKKEQTITSISVVEKGDIVSINAGATYYDGGVIPNWVKNKKWIVKEVVGNRVVINKSADGKNSINSPIHVKFLTIYKTEKITSYKVKVDIAYLNIRKGPGTNYSTTGEFTGAGAFTITETKPGKGSTKGWGKLKSGAGWISLDYAIKL